MPEPTDTADFFRSRLAEMIDLRHPLAVLASRLPWTQIEAALAPYFARRVRAGRVLEHDDLFGPSLQVAGAGVAAAGRPRLPLRLMASLLYLKHVYKLSDEELVERVTVDTPVQEKAIAHPVDSRLLEIARAKVVAAAKRAGIALKQTFAKEGKNLRRRAGGYAHAKQFKRLKKVLKRQRTVLGIVLREVQRKLCKLPATSVPAVDRLRALMGRAERIRTQRPKDKNKLYALHAPEVECIGKGKARRPYEFGVKVSVAVTHKQGLVVGARSFTGNPYDGHTLAEQLEQVKILTEDTGASPKQAVVDLGFRGVDAANPGIQIIHRGRFKSLTDAQRRWLKRRQAVEPTIGHLKHDNGMDRCWLQGATGDALHAVLCAAGYNIRWLLRAIMRLGLKGLFLRLIALLRTLIRVPHFFASNENTLSRAAARLP